MADIFISYAREDRERAGRIAGVLESCGWSVWWDHKILTGQAFDEAIERELEAAKCVIVLWSRESIGSEWVKNEAAFAAERGVLVPALIDRVKLPLEFRRRQTADLVEWDGRAGHEGFKALYSGIAAKVKPVQGVAERPPEVIPVRKSRPGLRWKWAAVPAIAIIIIVAAYWGWIAKEDHTPPADYLADRVAGIYHGDVVSDARGSSRSDVTLTITKLGPRKVRVESDYKRLGTIEIDLTRVGKTIQSAGGRPLLLLDMEQNPPRLSFNPDGEVAYEGVRGRQPTAASPVQASKPPEAVDAAYAIEDLWCAPANSKRPTNPKNPITARAAEMLSPEFTVDSNRHILLDKNNQPVSVVPAASLGPLDHLRFILVHFSAGTAKGLESYFQQPDVQASVHVMIARDGTVKQLVPFDFAARHAGVGEWKGLTGLNRYSVGIDLENWGQLQRKNGVWVSWAGREVPEAEVIPAADSAAGWHKYTDAQIRGFFFVSCALIKAYPAIEDIVGHEQISPGRKNDPGPAFPIQEMKRRLMIGGRRESGTENK